MLKLASEADLWYNRRVDIVVLGSARNTPSRINLLWRSIMVIVRPNSPESKTTFLYRLRDPETRAIRYVGKADSPTKRLATHLYQARHNLAISSHRTHKANWLRSLLLQGKMPILEIIEEVPVTQWQEREAYWIACYREQGEPLTNGTIGGDGAQGLVHAEETRLRIGQAGKGLKRSEVTRQRMSEAAKVRGVLEITRQKSIEVRKGKPGHPLSEATKQKIGNANRGKVRTAEDRRKNSEAHTGKVYSEATRQKVREANLGRKVSEASRARMREAATQREAMKRLKRVQETIE